jgi:PAS domain-containing protein
MPWRSAASVLLDRDGRYVDADARALELLGVADVEELRATSPDRFAALPPDPDEQEAWRRAYFASSAEGVLAEVAFRRLDGEFVRVRTAILDEGDGTYRALFYVVERPTTDLTPRVYRIAQVLEEWRSAERRLVELDPTSEDARRLEADIDLLRDQHRLLFERARERGRAADR